VESKRLQIKQVDAAMYQEKVASGGAPPMPTQENILHTETAVGAYSVYGQQSSKQQ
jgi:hypothetical protein